MFEIRHWRGSQHNAFEELCFQLREPDPPETRAIKPGNPDRGVDWYLIDAAGDRRGWQCKFVENIDKALPAMRSSLETALRELPDLVEMTFCVPFELAEAQPPGRGGRARRSARTRWRDAVTAWRNEIDGASRLRTLHLIDGPELLQRLTRDEHRGRVWFFFDRELFGLDWCRRHLDAVREFVAERYRPDLHVDVPVGHALEGLAASATFVNEMASAQRNLLSRLDELTPESLDHRPEGRALLTAAKAFTTAARHLRWGGDVVADRAPVAGVCGAADALRGPLDDAGNAYWEALREERADPASASRVDGSVHQTAWSQVRGAWEAYDDFVNLLDSAAASAAESSALMLYGEAGQGKTHLLCDAVQRMLDAGQPAVLLLGGHFPDAPVWNTIASELGIADRGYEQLVGAMEAAAEAAGHRFVVVLDALNEAPRERFWQQQLDSLRVRATRKGLVAVVASCRTEYLDVIGVDEGRTPWTLVEHRGLEGQEAEIAAVYFRHYGVPAPRVPLLHPDLKTPLFLKLYCEGWEQGTTPADGADAATAIFERYARAAAKTIDANLELDPDSRTTEKALVVFADELIAAESGHISVERARALFDSVLPSRDRYPRTLFQQLIDSGLLVRDVAPDASEASTDVVRFTYNRFSDHLIAGRLLDRYLDVSVGPGACFAKGSPLSSWLDGGDPGVVAALTNQVPERTGVELVDAINADDKSRPKRSWLLRLFVRSLPHRRPSATSTRSLELINEYGRSSGRSTDVFELMCHLAPNPDHPLGGDVLHRNIARTRSMARRDAKWGRILRSSSERYGAMQRLLSWARHGPYPEYDADVIESACLPLVWLLSLPDRPVRDESTKALAHVLQHHLGSASALVNRFAEIDDPAIHERLAVACHGAVLRGGHHDPDGVSALLAAMERVWGETTSSRPDLMTRDALRGVAEWQMQRLGSPAALEARYRTPRPAHPLSRERLEAKYPSVPYDEPGNGYEVLWSAVDGPMDEHLHYTVLVAIKRLVPLGQRETARYRDAGWVSRWLFQRAISLGWTPELFGEDDRLRHRSPEQRAHYEGFANKYVLIAFRELLARLADNVEVAADDGETEPFQGPWQLDLREVDPTLPPARVSYSADGDERRHPPFPIDDVDAWWISHRVGWSPGEAVAQDWGSQVRDLPALPGCICAQDDGGRRWVYLGGRVGCTEPVDSTQPEPASTIAGRDMTLAVQAVLVERRHLAATLAALRAAPWESLPAAPAGRYSYLGETPRALAALQPEWGWCRRLGWKCTLPNKALIATGEWEWSAGDDVSLSERLDHRVPATDLWNVGDLSWDGRGPWWRSKGEIVLQNRQTRKAARAAQRAMLAEEQWLGDALRRGGWALVVMAKCEKHLYGQETAARAGIVSWAQAFAAIGFDGERWDVGEWSAIAHPPGRVQMTPDDVVFAVAGDPSSRAIG